MKKPSILGARDDVARKLRSGRVPDLSSRIFAQVIAKAPAQVRSDVPGAVCKEA
jgi:hypothetical protein